MPEAGPGTEAQTLSDALRWAARRLAAAGVETPGVDARRLLAAASGLCAADLIARDGWLIDGAVSGKLREMIVRRCAGEPVSRILGEREFYGRAFSLSPATLDPRPDSETLIDTALEIVPALGGRDAALRVLDVGTGSGCLLVTLLAELPSARGVGTDINPQALSVAQGNARRHGVHSRARFEQREGLEGISDSYDLIVCNPPYVPTAEIRALAREVRDFDPHEALDGGPDGLDIFRKIIPPLERLVSSGWVLLETGAGQAQIVADLLRKHIAKSRQGRLLIRKDLGGHSRCVAMEIQL